MPFFIQAPPSLSIPRTNIELESPGLNKNIPNQNLRNNFFLGQDLLGKAYVVEKFSELYRAWEKNTMFSSSIYDIVEDINFKRIVEMGNDALPLIFQEIEKKPSTLVWAINQITGLTLKSNRRLTISESCKAWIKLRKQGKI